MSSLLRLLSYIICAFPLHLIALDEQTQQPIPLNKDFWIEEGVKKVHAHLLIGDFSKAYADACTAAETFPHSKLVLEAQIRASAKKGEEKALAAHWQSFIQKFPEEADNRELLEAMAWCVIEKGALSSSPMIRITSLLGGYFSRDIKGVSLLKKGFGDGNASLRATAIKLASGLSDSSLQEDIVHLFRTDHAWQVRLEAIKAIGQLRILEAEADLFRLLSNPYAHAEEQAAAVQALASMSESVSQAQMISLIQSPRVGMRLLACEYMAWFEQNAQLDLLYPLLSDPQAKVRAKVFQTLGRMRVSSVAGHSVGEIALQGVDDLNPCVGLSAAWLLTINDQKLGQRAFEKWLNHPLPSTRHLAAAAIAASGKHGASLALKYFKTHQDPFVKMNLALGLIGQRMEVKAAADILFQGLMQKKERWAWDEEQFFRVLGPSKVKHHDAIPNYPEAVNQLAQLEVLQILCMLNFPQAQKALRNFLKESRWEISGLASVLLLTEGDEAAIDQVKELLDDPEGAIKTQSALILALWGREEQVVSLLQQHYKTADRELKAQILEGIGRIGSISSLSFLTERLQEPYQTLRIIAAAALLECLYH